MSKKKSSSHVWIWVGVGTLLLGGAAYLIFRNKSKQTTSNLTKAANKATAYNQSLYETTSPADTVTNTAPIGTGKGATMNDDSFPLHLGSRGSNVAQLQQALGGLIIDGIYGQLTQAEVMKSLGKATVDSQQELDSIVKQGDNISTKALGFNLGF